MLKLDQNNAYSMALFSGDISYANLNSPIWDYWGNMVQPLANHVPIMFSVGNHELFDLFEAYQHRFRMPSACFLRRRHTAQTQHTHPPLTILLHR